MGRIIVEIAPAGEKLDCIIHEPGRFEERFYIRPTLLAEFVRGRNNITVEPLGTLPEFILRSTSAHPDELQAIRELFTRPEDVRPLRATRLAP